MPETRIDEAVSAGRRRSWPSWLYPAVWPPRKQVNPNAKADEAWGWLPPPLVGEGQEGADRAGCTTSCSIRIRFGRRSCCGCRSSTCRRTTPRKLVNYFAAVDGADYPYDFDPRTRESHLAAAKDAHPNRFDDALKIVTDNNYCVKCHLVGDFDAHGQRARQGAAVGPGVQALASRFRARLGRQSQADAAVHRHAGEHSARQGRQPGVVQGHAQRSSSTAWSIC